MHYAKISLAVFIISVIASIIGGIFMFIPVLGMIINVGLNIIVFVIWLVSWIYALSGEEKGIPLVSDLAKKFKF